MRRSSYAETVRAAGRSATERLGVKESRLGWLALSRGTLDRVADRRRDTAWLDRAWNDPLTRVLMIDQGRVLVRVHDTPALVFVPPSEVPESEVAESEVPAAAQSDQNADADADADADPDAGSGTGTDTVTGQERYLLGVDDDGIAYFAVPGALPAVDGAEPSGLRRVGALLGDRDSGLLTHAVALLNWHTTHRRCPRCGGPTVPASAGHTRVCPADGSEHFPRVDPAVIMLVRDDRDRILLARHPAWPERRVSILAGFVEPGESLEQAVAREVLEEAGLVVTDVEYLGSQPWPLPQSLMLGFLCRAAGAQEIRTDDEEITDAEWYTRDELLAAATEGEILLPGRISIARQLIEHWYGSELPGTWGL